MVEQNTPIKPLSVNKAWQGKRFKTKDYLQYEKQVLFLLPKIIIPDGKLLLEITFGMSNKASDIDNPLKPFLDILQKKYNFDDKQVYKLIVNKEITAKNQEFIKFKITKYEN